jgi:hypothetical protein
VEIDRGRLLDEVLNVLADPAVSDADAGRLVRARIGMPRLQAARRPTAEREPRDHRHFDLLAARYKYLRTFTAAVITALPLTGNTASPDVAALLDAMDVLRELNAAGRTTVPGQAATPAATSFVPARWGLPRHDPGPGPRRRVPALLGTERAVRGTGTAALRRPVGARIPPLHRSDHAAHPHQTRGLRSATTSAPSPAPTPTRRGSCNGSRLSSTPP